jgi:predicted amidohydrolase YtcJ
MTQIPARILNQQTIGSAIRAARLSRPLWLSLLALLPVSLLASCAPATEGARVADSIYTNARIYTMEADAPWAEAVAIKGERFVAVGSRSQVDLWRGPGTQVVDLNGAFVTPGLIDGHTHFDSAGRLLMGANLLEVSDAAGIREALSAVAERMPEGGAITGGSWGAYESWSAGSTGEEKETAGEKEELFRPDKSVIDPVTPRHPVLVNRWDGSMYLANSLALEMAGIDRNTRAPDGVTMHRDADGQPTGLFEGNGRAISRMFRNLPRTSHEQRLEESRLALKSMAEAGITMIHDITPPAQLAIFQELYENDELTARIRPRPTLEKAESLEHVGIKEGFGDPILRFAGLKDFVDGIMGSWGAMFYEPYEDRPDHYGNWRVRVTPEPGLEEYIRRGYLAGFSPHIHAIGDKGVDTLLTMYERVIDEFDILDHRWRVIHAQVVHDKDFERFGELGLVAEINPYHLSDDMRWMEERIGDRCRGAYAFKSLKDNGAILVFGSDWPGTNAAIYHQHPRYLIHAAVNRTTLDGTPENGWYPEQKITVHEALEAFTINGAWANFEEDEFGTIRIGKYADLTIMDQNLMEIDPTDILKTEVLYTIVGGREVYRNSEVLSGR